MRLREIDAHVLDLLVDGASSFAALYYGLLHHWGHATMPVEDALEVLQRLEDRRLVQARQMQPDGGFRTPNAADYDRAKREYSQWLPQATASEVAVDEVGLWYEITRRGRQAWSRWRTDGGDDRGRWMLDDRADQGILEVRADRKEVAEGALDRWLAEHGEVQEVPGTRESATVSEFVMRDGTRVPDGVLVRCRYRPKKPTEKE